MSNLFHLGVVNGYRYHSLPYLAGRLECPTRDPSVYTHICATPWLGRIFKHTCECIQHSYHGIRRIPDGFKSTVHGNVTPAGVLLNDAEGGTAREGPRSQERERG